ncbi:hypothetical protein GCM10022248_90330 [Nonomuraea soli]
MPSFWVQRLTSINATKLLVDADPVVCEFALYLIFSGQFIVLVVAQAVTEEVGDKESGVSFVGIARDQVGQRLGVAADSCLDPIAGISLPLGCGASRSGLLREDRHFIADLHRYRGPVADGC